MNQVSIGSGNVLSPIQLQAITWTNAHLLSIGSLRTNFSEIQIEIQSFSFKKMHLKMSSAKWRPFCPGGDELTEPSGPKLSKILIEIQTFSLKKMHFKLSSAKWRWFCFTLCVLKVCVRMYIYKEPPNMYWHVFYSERERLRLSLCQNFCYQPVTGISTKWQHSHFCVLFP